MSRGGAGGAAESCCSLLHLCYEKQKKRPVVSHQKKNQQHQLNMGNATNMDSSGRRVIIQVRKYM